MPSPICGLQDQPPNVPIHLNQGMIQISRSSIFIENTYVGHQWDQSNPQCPITATIQSSNMGGGCTIIEAIYGLISDLGSLDEDMLDY